MEVLTLSNSNFTGLSSDYPYDPTLVVNTNNYVSYEGLNVSIIDGLCAAVDTSTNYYSSFVLSNKSNVNNILTVDEIPEYYPYSLTTYLGLYVAGNVLPQTEVLATSVSPLLSVVAYPLSFIKYQTDNQYQNFTINFIDDAVCTITQVINAQTYYLSYYQANTGFGTFLMVNRYTTDEVNLFNYLYDANFSQIVLTKKVNGLQQYVSYGNKLQCLSMVDFVTGGDVFVNSSAFKIRNFNGLDVTLPTDWYSYTKKINLDGLNVNPERSVENLPLNYLLNFTVENLTDNSLPVNIMPFKNDKDNENSLSRGSIINNKYDGVIHREYTSLNTGTNQTKGSPDFNVTYNSYTTQLLIPKDNTTFFYFPYEPFPIVKLNINDSSLVESGAIAGDRPLNSDKVFKHKVKEQFTIQYNKNNTEQTGTYLCSWLKGGATLSALPVWVDRYYDPSIINSIDALTYEDTYQTDFDKVKLTNTLPVFDVKSNLTFEAGFQYAIQHLGDTNVVELINSLSANLVVENIDNKYDYLDQYFQYTGNEIVLGDLYYSKLFTDLNLADIRKYNNFTLSFDLAVSNWNKSIGYQLLGNYNTGGFGIFNDQNITPFITTYNNDTIKIYNTNVELLDSVSVGEPIIYFNKLDPVGTTIAITNANSVFRVDFNSVIIDKKKIPSVGKYSSYYSTLEHTYCYSETLSTIRINNLSLDYEPFAGKFIYVTVPQSTSSRSVAVVNDVVYIVNGYNIKSNKEKILFTINYNNQQGLVLYEIATNKTTILYISNIINDYVINSDGTIYLLYNYNMLILTDAVYRMQTVNNFPQKLFTNQPSLSGLQFLGLDYYTNSANGEVVDEGLCFVGFDKTSKTIVTTNTIKNGNLIDIKKTVTDSASTATGYRNVTNYGFNTANLTKPGQLEFRLGLPNVYDKTNIKLFRYIHDVSLLEPGYHNFIIRFDSVNGVYTIYIDGIKVNEIAFQGGQYSFSNILNRNFFVGNCIYYNNKSLGIYVKNPTYYFTKPIDIKNVYVYNRVLTYYELLLFLKLNFPISDIKFQLPTGKRNFVETIQQFFKFKVPGFKSNYFNVNIINLPVTGALKSTLDKTFIEIINRNKPGYTQLNTISYHD